MSAMEQFFEHSQDTLTLVATSNQQPTIRYGLGVIAVDDGSKRGVYIEATPLDQEPYTWTQPANPELERYKSYGHNWVGAIVLRQKWHQQLESVQADFPNIAISD